MIELDELYFQRNSANRKGNEIEREKKLIHKVHNLINKSI